MTTSSHALNFFPCSNSYYAIRQIFWSRKNLDLLIYWLETPLHFYPTLRTCHLLWSTSRCAKNTTVVKYLMDSLSLNRPWTLCHRDSSTLGGVLSPLRLSDHRQIGQLWCCLTLSNKTSYGLWAKHFMSNGGEIFSLESLYAVRIWPCDGGHRLGTIYMASRLSVSFSMMNRFISAWIASRSPRKQPESKMSVSNFTPKSFNVIIHTCLWTN